MFDKKNTIGCYGLILIFLGKLIFCTIFFLPIIVVVILIYVKHKYFLNNYIIILKIIHLMQFIKHYLQLLYNLTCII